MIVKTASWLLLLLATVPPLSPGDRIQLMTASDGQANIDEAGLYPLLRNAQQWTPDDESGARMPDYEEIEAKPAQARGEVFLIEGVLEAWNTQPRWFYRSGPWDGPMQRWVIAAGPKRDRIVVVYLVAPTPQMQTALLHRRQPVRLVARFYKVWLDAEAGDNAKTYLTFVGRDARLIDRFRSDNSPWWLAPAMAVLLCSSAAWLLYRVLHLRHRIVTTLSSAPAEFSVDSGDPGNSPETTKILDPEPLLPTDPAAALEELQRRRDVEDKR